MLQKKSKSRSRDFLYLLYLKITRDILATGGLYARKRSRYIQRCNGLLSGAVGNHHAKAKAEARPNGVHTRGPGCPPADLRQVSCGTGAGS